MASARRALPGKHLRKRKSNSQRYFPARRCAHAKRPSWRSRRWASTQPGFELHEPLAGGFRAEQALEAFADIGAEGSALLVGHEPDLSNVVGELTGGRVDLKKGGVAVVKLGGGGGELVLLLRPVELALIAGAVDVAV